MSRQTKNRKYKSKEVAFKEGFSFDLPRPSWEVMRKCTSVRYLVHTGDYIFKSRELGHVEVGLDAKDARGVKHWNEVTRYPNKLVSQNHFIYDI